MQTKIDIYYIHICIYFQNFITNQNQLANKFNTVNETRMKKFFKFIRKQN